nr:reverse transcriptase domain-containing protein [Tanacetum cinerariifolium]
MMSLGGSIVASLENINSFLAVYTPPNGLIRTDFEQEGVVPKVMLHIFKEFVLLLGRHSLNNEVPRMVVCKIGKPWVHFDEGSLIGKDGRRLGFNTLFREEERGIFFEKTGHRPGYHRKVLYESSMEAGMTKETTDTLDDSGMRLKNGSNNGLRIWYWSFNLDNQRLNVMASLPTRRVSSPLKTSIKALPVLKKDLLRIRGTRGSASKSKTTKSAEKWNVPTLTKTSSATLTGREIKRSGGGGSLLLEAFLNDDPSLPPPNQGNYLPQVRKELKICEAKSDKSSIDEPPEVKLKDLSPHLEYAFLEGDDKLPVIIAKDLSN